MIREILLMSRRLPRIKHCHTTGGYRLHAEHVHPEIEILYLKEGIQHFKIDNEYIELNPGDIIIVNSLIPHSNYLSETEYTYIQFDFHGILDSEDAGFLLSSSDNIPYLKPYIRLSRNNSSYNRLLKLISDICEHSGNGNIPEYCKGDFYRLYDFMQENRMFAPEDNSLTAPGFDRIRDIVDYINIHYFENITLDTLSKFSGLNASYLCRCFKKLTNYTIIEYINYVRIKNAERMLTTSDMSVSEVSLAAGFPSQSYFNRAFKKQFSFTPLLYKRIKNECFQPYDQEYIHLHNEKGEIR